jgi:hypothetical protein
MQRSSWIDPAHLPRACYASPSNRLTPYIPLQLYSHPGHTMCAGSPIECVDEDAGVFSLRAYYSVPLQRKGSFTLYVRTRWGDGSLKDLRNILKCILTSYRHRPPPTAAGRPSGKVSVPVGACRLQRDPLSVVEYNDCNGAMRSLVCAGLDVNTWANCRSADDPFPYRWMSHMSAVPKCMSLAKVIAWLPLQTSVWTAEEPNQCFPIKIRYGAISHSKNKRNH